VTKADALVLEAPRRLVKEEFEIPEVGDDDALLRVEACGLCGTDHEQFTGVLPSGFVFVPGHESVGVIEEIGPQASERFGVKTGERVAVEVFQSCRSCGPCRAGDYRRCASHGIGDMYGFIPVSKPPSLWGGYATYQYLSPDTMLHKVPDGIEPIVSTLFNPLGAGIRWGATLPGTCEGDVVAVLGPGIRGLAACAAAKTAGAGFVMVTGKERDLERLSLAERFGADLSVNVDAEDPCAALRRATGGLADIVVDVTAKAPEALAQAVALARPAGTVVLAGTRGGVEPKGFDPDLVVYKELRILGALGVDAPAYSSALDMLSAGSFPFEELPRTVSSLDAAAELLSAMGGEGGRPPVHGVIAPWS
jgi:alcohol dehydrogenase